VLGRTVGFEPGKVLGGAHGYEHRRTKGVGYEEGRGFRSGNMTENAKVHVFRWSAEALKGAGDGEQQAESSDSDDN